MLTARGWSALGAGTGSGLLWVALGEIELMVVGVFLVAASLVALWSVSRGRSSVRLERHLFPIVVHEGDRATVRIELSHPGHRPLRNVLLEDEVRELGAARFVAARLPAGATLEARYEISCRRRGVYLVGPASVDISDPLGLAQAGGPVGRTDRLVVYPSVEDLDGLPSVRGHDPSQQSSRPHFAPRGGEDFFTLREYQHGDDLRRVHWRSSAKRDELMIRQLENPWQSRSMVLLDPRASSYPTGDAFEQAVRGAASVVRHLHRTGFSVDLWAGPFPVRPDGRDGHRSAMEALAVVETIPGLDVRGVAARIRGRAGGGMMVVVTGDPDPDLLSAFTLLARAFGRSMLMTVNGASTLSFRQVGAVTVSTTPDAPWRPAWIRAVRQSWSTVSAG